MWRVSVWDSVAVHNGGMVDWVTGKTTTDDVGDRLDVYWGVLTQSDGRLSQKQTSEAAL
jgi:hypothetical protein